MNKYSREILCEHCRAEIYDDDIICNLNEVYCGDDFIVHEECVADSFHDNKLSVIEYVFDDLNILSEVFDKHLTKYVAYEYFEGLEEEDE